MTILLIVLLIIAAVLLLCLIRTLMLKPTPAREATIDAKADDRARAYGEKLGKMIRCETISNRHDPSREKFLKFHQLLEELFPEIHKTCEKHVFNGSLLFKWEGSGKKEPIMFMSHHDVVEASGEWQHDPFGGEIIDDKVWGRGTVDTKGNLFCIMQSIEELIKEGHQPEQDIYIASSCTEEVSGEGAPLTAQYLKDHGIKLRFMMDEGGMIMEEPIGGLKGTYGVVGVLEKGYGDLKFIARGKGGHSSAPPKNTAMARLAAFVHEAETKNLFRPYLNSTMEEMFRRFTPNMNFGMKFIMANLWLFKPLFIRLLPSINSMAGAMVKTTLTFTMAKGSEGYNVIPQEAYVTGNLRFSHHQATEESVRIMTELAKKYDIETEVIQTHDPCPEVSYTSEAFKLVEEVMGEIYPDVGVSPYVMTGGTDCKFYTEVCENALRFAPLYINKQQLGSIHTRDENIDIASLSKGIDFFKTIIRKA